MNELWDKIQGQQKSKEILEKIIKSRRVPHAFLFYGKEGIGKFFTALQFAKIVNQKSDQKKSEYLFHKISLLQEPYIKLIIPLPRGKGESGDDNATEKLTKDVLSNLTDEISKKAQNPYYKIQLDNANNIKINSIREITKFVNTAITDLEFRFILIEDAHLMNDQAQNALLKNLEEPPEGIIFILLTSNKDKLLTTIQSRCWQINFEPLTLDHVQSILINYFIIDKDVSANISNYSEGSITNALNLLNNIDLNYLLKKTISVLRFSLAKKYNMAYKELSEYLRNNTNSIKIIIRLIKLWLNDILRQKYSIFGYYFEDYKETLVKFNERYDHSTVEYIFKLLDKLEEYEDKNLNLNVVCLNLIFEISVIATKG